MVVGPPSAQDVRPAHDSHEVGMTPRSPVKPPEPFAWVPSAPPPASGVRHAPVRVPAPSRPGVTPSVVPFSACVSPPGDRAATETGQNDGIGDPSRSLRLSAAEATLEGSQERTTTGLTRGAHARDVVIDTTSPKARPSRGAPPKRFVLIVGCAAALAIVAFVLGGRALLTGREQPPRAAAKTVEPSPIESTLANHPTPTPPASAVSPLPAASESALKPFNQDRARAALDALAPSLAECKLPRSKPVRVKVTFAPTGSVAAASVLPPTTGKPAACLSARVKAASLAAFDGTTTSYVHTFQGTGKP
jgi:hypothetical protein